MMLIAVLALSALLFVGHFNQRNLEKVPDAFDGRVADTPDRGGGGGDDGGGGGGDGDPIDCTGPSPPPVCTTTTP
ncbi:MAG: hypothetical protein ACRDVM_07355 [Acidimicrobiia bacterium]